MHAARVLTAKFGAAPPAGQPSSREGALRRLYSLLVCRWNTRHTTVGTSLLAKFVEWEDELLRRLDGPRAKERDDVNRGDTRRIYLQSAIRYSVRTTCFPDTISHHSTQRTLRPGYLR